MKKFFIFFVLAISSGVTLNAQRIDESNSLFGNRAYVNDAPQVHVNAVQNLGAQRKKSKTEDTSTKYYPKPRYVADTLYCRVIAKKRGWFAPAGDTLTSEQAFHVNQCFRFTERAKDGKWMHMESLDGYGKYSDNHNISIYMFNKEARGAESVPKQIRDKFSEVVQWTCKENSKGDVIQQRGYDNKGDLVYSYNLTWKDHNTTAGQYTDAWGIPIKLESDSIYNITIPIVKYNSCGFDSLVCYVDEYGFSVHDAYGVYKNLYETDSNGRIRKITYCNDFGQPMMSKIGYSKMINKMDKKGRVVERHYFDERNNPIKYSDDSYFTIVYTPSMQVEYDDYGNWTDIHYYDGEMKPDTLEYGVHHVHRAFNDRGRRTLLTTYGLDGKHTAYYSSGEAFDVRMYDNQGHIVYSSLLQADSLNLIQDKDQYIQSFFTYDSKGNTVTRDSYSWIDGKKLLYFQTRLDTITGKEIQINYNPAKNNQGAYYQYSEYDADKKLSLRYFYSADNINKRITDDYGEYYTYKRIKDNTSKDIEIQTEMYLDSCGALTMPYWRVDNYAFSELTIDSATCIKSRKLLDENQSVIDRYYYKYSDNTFSERDYIQQLNFAGIPARSAGKGLLYYRAKCIYDVYGDVVSDIAYNEWGEPSLICNNLYGYHYKAKEGGKWVYYDESNKQINRSEFYENSPKALIIEVIDSIAYQFGLKDGDVIVRYGDAILGTTWGNDIPLHFCTEAVRLANQKKSLWVMRHNLIKKQSKIIKIDLPEGTLSQLGFITHTQFYTTAENERFINTYKRDSLLVGQCGVFVQDDKNQTTGYMIFPSKLNRDEATCYFKYGLKDPMYILKIEAIVTDEEGNERYQSYSLGDSWMNCKSLIWHDEDEKIKMVLFVTSDGQTVHRISKDTRFFASEAFCNSVELFPHQIDKLKNLDVSVPYDASSDEFGKSDFMNFYNNVVKNKD